MSYSQDLCTVGRSGAFQGQVFGLSAGRTVRDENCERLKLSKYLYDMGMKVSAVALLCQDERVFKAMAMEKEEVVRLLFRNGIPKSEVFKDKEFSQAWQPK